MNANTNNALPAPKSRVAYCLLGILFGGLGIHNFYAGRKKRGLIELVLGFLLGLIALGLMFTEVPVDQLESIKLTINLLKLIPYIWIVIDLCKVKEDGNGVPFK